MMGATSRLKRNSATHLQCEKTLEEARALLISYFGSFGLTDPVLVKSLVEECLLRAREQYVRSAPNALLCRAMEEAQRQVDIAIVREMNISDTMYADVIAKARAAILLSGMVQINELLRFRTKSNHGELAKKIYSALPQPTPPESSLRMRKQEISFVLSR